MSYFDKNNDGIIDYDEFLFAIRVIQCNNQRENPIKEDKPSSTKPS